MYWIYTSGVHEIVILAVGDVALIIAVSISLFLDYPVLLNSFSIIKFLMLSSRHSSVLTKFRCRSDFILEVVRQPEPN